MQELTYEQYKSNGGTSDHNVFLLLRKDCEAELERQTFGRIDEIDDNIARCMVVIMDEVLSDDNADVQSYSNGIESITYSNHSTEGRSKKIREIVLRYLPKELTYRGTKC